MIVYYTERPLQIRDDGLRPVIAPFKTPLRTSGMMDLGKRPSDNKNPNNSRMDRSFSFYQKRFVRWIQILHFSPCDKLISIYMYYLSLSDHLSILQVMVFIFNAFSITWATTRENILILDQRATDLYHSRVIEKNKNRCELKRR